MSEPRPNDSTNPEGPEVFNPAMQSPGAQLAALREARGWTVEQVASQLNLAPRQVRAIESDDYPALPGMATTRGFMRAYAKLLQVDPGPLLTSISGETVVVTETTAMRKAVPTTFSESHLPLRSDNRGSKARKLVAVLVVAALGVGAWAVQHQGGLGFLSAALFSHSGKQNEQAPVRPDEVSGKSVQPSDQHFQSSSGGEAITTAPSSDLMPPGGATGQGQSASAADTPVTQPSTPAVAAVPPAATSGISATQEPAAVEAAKQRDTSGANALVLKIREDSWLEIRRANKLVVAKLAKAGETETIDMTAPVTLLVGNAQGIDATLRGKPVQILANRKNNTARLTFE